MKQYIISLVSMLLMLSFLPAVYAQKEMKGRIEDKIALETSMENRLKQVLTEITGTEKIIVIIKLQLVSEKDEVKDITQEKNDDFILPGVPIKEVISQKQVGDALTAALGEDTRTLVKKMHVTILLDKSVSNSVVKVVNEVASGLLGVDASRGDTLEVKQMHFQKNPFYWTDLIYPPNIYWVLLIIGGILFASALILFLFGPFRLFTSNFARGVVDAVQAIRETGKAGQDESFFRQGPELTADTGKETVQKGAQGLFSKEMPFSFINESNIGSLIYLIKNEDAQTISIILNYLLPELTSKIILALPPEKIKEVGALLSTTQELDPMEVDKIEAVIKKKIGYLLGGEEKLIRVLDYVDDNTKTLILSSLRSTDISLADKIQKSLITVEILASLDVSAIQTVIKTLTPAVFSQIIKSMNEQLREKILTILPHGAAIRIKQEMEMGKPFTPQRLETEKRRVVQLIRRMEERGIINR